jgi:hypothetical protein
MLIWMLDLIEGASMSHGIIKSLLIEFRVALRL